MHIISFHFHTLIHMRNNPKTFCLSPLLPGSHISTILFHLASQQEASNLTTYYPNYKNLKSKAFCNLDVHIYAKLQYICEHRNVNPASEIEGVHSKGIREGYYRKVEISTVGRSNLTFPWQIKWEHQKIYPRHKQ